MAELSVEETVLMGRISTLTELLDNITAAYSALQPIGARSSTTAWTQVPSCQQFAVTYLDVVGSTVGILQQAHQKVTDLVQGLRDFVDDVDLVDGEARTALEALEESVGKQLPVPGATPPSLPPYRGSRPPFFE